MPGHPARSGSTRYGPQTGPALTKPRKRVLAHPGNDPSREAGDLQKPKYILEKCQFCKYLYTQGKMFHVEHRGLILLNCPAQTGQALGISIHSALSKTGHFLF